MKFDRWGRLALLTAALLLSCGLAWLLLPGVGAVKLLLFAGLVLFLAELLYRLDRWLGRRADTGRRDRLPR